MAQDPLTSPAGASSGEVSDRLERIEQSLDRLTGALDQAMTTAPNVVATATDVMDEFLLAAQDRGIDIDALLRAGGGALGRLARLVQSPQFARLLDSGALSPDSLSTLARAGDALAETSAEAGDKAGILALLRASRDPDVQRALDFVLRLMKRFGRGLAQRDLDHREEDFHE
jgi:uncharacterized protein YjgD (DUF1641 family)